jgi:uncharacterized paraquat-inducible protein A
MSTRMQLLCVVLIGLSLAGATSHLRRPEPTRMNDGSQHYVYCPECGLEMTIPPEMERKQTFCPHCGPGKQLEINSYSRTNGEAPLPTNRLLVAALFGVPCILLFGVYLLGRKREGQKPTDVEEVFRFACPGCGHEIASNAYREGSTAVCPACAEMFVVPNSAASDRLADRPEATGDLKDEVKSSPRRTLSGTRRRPRR